MSPKRVRLDNELAKLQDRLVRLQERVIKALLRAIEAMKNQDPELAQKIIKKDRKINKLRYKIERYCVMMIATQQPMASDLRHIIGAMHIAVEMERMGDHAAGIAKLVLEMCHEPLLKPLIDLPRMANISAEMLRDSVRAFTTGDLDLAQQVVARDDEVDNLYQQIFRELLTYMLQDPSNIERATYLLWASHAVERIGDRATNIAERTVFAETGKLKHEAKEILDPIFVDEETACDVSGAPQEVAEAAPETEDATS